MARRPPAAPTPPTASRSPAPETGPQPTGTLVEKLALHRRSDYISAESRPGADRCLPRSYAGLAQW